MKPKGGQSARPRFHVYFPIRSVESVQEYEALKKQILEEYAFFDANAIDACRFIYGVQEPEVFWHDGLTTIDAALNPLHREIREGSRNTTLSRTAGKILKRHGLCAEAKKAFEKAAENCFPPLEHEELLSIWRSAVRFYKRTILSDPAYIPPEKYEAKQEDPSELPDPVLLSSIITPPVKPPELISGVLRQGHKMLIAGPSKAGKSFLLMELAIAVAEGKQWMGFGCRQGRVLYINLEIDPSSCLDRFLKIYDALGYTRRHAENILVWNLRGHARPLDQLAPVLIDKMIDENIAAVIVDPIYKVITGDENNASEMGAFCNQFDTICTALGASVIYCHHHSKGAQGNKRAMDRASGSGVFARDPDALLDIIALKKPAGVQEMEDCEEEEEEKENFEEAAEVSAWQMEASLREFPPIKNIKFFFEHPVHRIDSEGLLSAYHAEGSSSANLSASSKRTSMLQRRKRLDSAFEELSRSGIVTVNAIAEHLGLSKTTIRSYLKEFSDDYINLNGVVLERPVLDNSSKNPGFSGASK